MKLSRVVQLTEAHHEPVAAPSAVHVAFVEVLAELSNLACSTGHPAARIMQKLLPSLLNDITEVPAEVLGEFCQRFGDLMQRVSNAENAPPPSLADILEEDRTDPLLQTEPGKGSDGESRPALATQSQG